MITQQQLVEAGWLLDIPTGRLTIKRDLTKVTSYTSSFFYLYNTALPVVFSKNTWVKYEIDVYNRDARYAVYSNDRIVEPQTDSNGVDWIEDDFDVVVTTEWHPVDRPLALVSVGVSYKHPNSVGDGTHTLELVRCIRDFECELFYVESGEYLIREEETNQSTTVPTITMYRVKEREAERLIRLTDGLRSADFRGTRPNMVELRHITDRLTREYVVSGHYKVFEYTKMLSQRHGNGSS